MPKNILILTVDCWNLNIGANSSYTYSNLFSSMDDYNISNIYTRDELPNDPCCSKYFQISENRIIKSLFKRKTKTGKEVVCGVASDEANSLAVNQQKELYSKHRKRFCYTKKIIRELIWKFSAWKSKELDTFLESVKPDAVIFTMEGYIHFNRICRYVLKKTGAKGIGYFWDDNFTYKQRSSVGYKVLRLLQRKSLKKLAKKTAAFWAIAPKTKKEADDFFGIDCILLPKPAEKDDDIIFDSQKPIVKPIKMMYAGNLMIGRMDTVRAVAKAMAEINKEGENLTLDVYSNTEIPNDLMNFGNGVIFHPPVSQSEVLNLQQRADVLLFAEDIVGKDRKVARLSFSTKIPDYLSSGKCILAIGDNDTAPMEYFRSENIALCAGNEGELLEQLGKIVNTPEILIEYGRRAYECARKNHSKEKIQKKVSDTINQVTSDN